MDAVIRNEHGQRTLQIDATPMMAVCPACGETIWGRIVRTTGVLPAARCDHDVFIVVETECTKCFAHSLARCDVKLRSIENLIRLPIAEAMMNKNELKRRDNILAKVYVKARERMKRILSYEEALRNRKRVRKLV